MNKRARLARRVLREHRQGWPWHRSLEGVLPGLGRVYYHWTCPRCFKEEYRMLPMEPPRAYR